MSISTGVVAKRSAVLIAAALLMGGSALTQAAQEILSIQISGVPGDAAFAAANSLPPNSVEVLSASLGLSTAVNISASNGETVSKPNFADLAIFKKFNNSSPALAMAEMTGRLIPQAFLTFWTGAPGSFTKYYTVVLTNVYITSLGIADSAGSDGATEAVTFAYAQIRFTNNLTGASECFNRLTGSIC